MKAQRLNKHIEAGSVHPQDQVYDPTAFGSITSSTTEFQKLISNLTGLSGPSKIDKDVGELEWDALDDILSQLTEASSTESQTFTSRLKHRWTLHKLKKIDRLEREKLGGNQSLARNRLQTRSPSPEDRTRTIISM